ncbi:hypothetical protein MASR1M46_20330 [Bacteroidales bacterium]
MKFLLAAAILITASGSLFSQSSRGGSLFYEEMRLLEGAEREKLIVKEIIFVKSDYLAAGSDDDYFTLPMTPQSAQKIAEFFNASLPTPFIVDIIYKKAELKLEPFNFIPRGNRNETPDLFYDHSKIVHAQKKASGSTPGVFTAGTKKDIVISSKLSDPRRTHHVTIYGWHRLTGIPIQPVTNIHIDTYVDYSHGVRLVSNKILIDGKEYDYRVILRDSTLYSLLSSEKEPLTVTSYNY